MRKCFFISAAGIILCVILYFYYKTIKGDYIENFLKVDERWRALGYYNMPYDDYVLYYNLELPQTFEEIREKLMDNFSCSNYDNYVNHHMKDFLSKEYQRFIYYIPLYNPENFKIEGYILLSAGIDGKINNRYSWRDTLFINDFQEINDFCINDIKNRLKLYDTNKLSGKLGSDKKNGRKIYFNIFNYFFGKKDIFISYRNIIDEYKRYVRCTYSMSQLIEEFEVLIDRWGEQFKNIGMLKICSYKGIMDVDTIIDNNRYIFFRHDDYLIRNRLYDCREIKLSDTLIFVGTRSNVDLENKIIDFVNCIQIEEEIVR